MNQYSKINPFYASIKERRCLSSHHSKKNTQHIVLNLKGSGLTYQVGDSIGIFPIHDDDLTERTLRAIKAEGNEIILDRHSGQVFDLKHYLSKKANITEISRKLIQEVCARQTSSEKKDFLTELLTENRRDDYKQFINDHEIWDFLAHHFEVKFTVQEFCDLLLPLLPRFILSLHLK